MAVVATLTPLLPSNQLSNDLSFSAAHITGPIPSEIGRLSKLTSAVRFYSNSLTYSIPSELGQLSVPMKLFCHAHEHTGLNLYNSPCTYSHFQQLADTLQLNENSLSGYCPTHFAHFALTLISLCANANTCNPRDRCRLSLAS